MDHFAKLAAFARENGLFSPGDHVLVCVSGGADSMCLLHSLQKNAKALDISVSAAHFNHRLRGQESDQDEAFVRDWCEARGIPFRSGSADVAAEAAARVAGIEETARELRYEFFAQAAEILGCSKIATAHTADDNLETVLLRLARGAGLRGLCGIPPRRGNIIRPLLFMTRREVEEYDRAQNVPYREDASNAGDEYARNRLRHHAVPVLRSLNPSVARSALETTALLREDEAFLSGLAEEFIQENVRGGAVDAAALLALPRPVASRVVRSMADGLSAEHVRSVLSLAENRCPSSSLDLPGTTVRREYGQLIFGWEERQSFAPFSLSPGETVENSSLGLRFSAELCEIRDEIYKSFTTFLFKFDAICGKITVRPRRPGDQLRLSPRSGTQSLKKLFIDRKIPRAARDRVPVLCDQSGPLAVYGIGSDCRVWCSPGDRVLKIKIEEITQL